MELFRVHAYSVSPKRTEESEEVPLGGAVRINNEIRGVIQESNREAGFHNQTMVDFVFEGESRENGIRKAILSFGFGSPPEARAGGIALAGALASAMDHRSHPCLFIPAAMEEASRRRVILWTFPEEDVFRLRRGDDGPSIEVIKNVFSQRSKLRKAALFEGRNNPSEFLGGRVLDYQAGSLRRDVADFWVSRFLHCRSGISDDSGTRLLAKVIRATFEKSESTEAREQLHAGMMAIRRSPKKQITLKEFANRYLDGEAKELYSKACPKEGTTSRFSFRTEVFDETLKYRVFHLDTDVIVSSPFGEVGKSVNIEGKEKRRLTCEGGISEEKVRTRHG